MPKMGSLCDIYELTKIKSSQNAKTPKRHMLAFHQARMLGLTGIRFVVLQATGRRRRLKRGGVAY